MLSLEIEVSLELSNAKGVTETGPPGLSGSCEILELRESGFQIGVIKLCKTYLEVYRCTT